MRSKYYSYHIYDNGSEVRDAWRGAGPTDWYEDDKLWLYLFDPDLKRPRCCCVSTFYRYALCSPHVGLEKGRYCASLMDKQFGDMRSQTILATTIEERRREFDRKYGTYMVLKS